MKSAIHRNGPTSTPTTSPVEPFDLATGVELYRSLGWPTCLDARRRQLVVHTGDVLDALIFPARLASAVATELSTSLMFGPACTDSDHRWWTFLTARCQRPNLELPVELRTARVHAVPRGGHAIVPHPADAEHWPQRPQQDHPLPPWSAVVAIARKVLQAQR
jgi:hypothetical protein